MTIGVIDPDGLTDTAIGELTANADRLFSLSPASPTSSAIHPTRFIGPGWVDLHAHIYNAVTPISVDPDRVGLDDGVHLLADAGSAGAFTLPGLIEYVRPRAQTQIRSWINIGSHGLVHLRETSQASFIDVDATITAIEAARDTVCGVKVHSSGAIVGDMGLQPLQLARLVARETGLPLMVHIGEAPPLIDDVLDLLDPGDVVTHCFHGKTGTPWRSDGTPSPALARALDRGVLLDVGHGAASFSHDVALRAISAGFRPSSISTDIHIRNVDGPVYNLATVMTKLLDCGLSMADVIAAVTTAPRRAITAETPWRTPEGTLLHATVFDVLDHAPPSREYRDAGGVTAHPAQHIVPVATIINGVWRGCIQR